MSPESVWKLADRKIPRIGILGGTFDPIHKGHIEMCNVAIDTFRLDFVWLLITGDPPHKGDDVGPAEDRYQMVELACKGNDKLAANRMEMDRPGQTYTVDTLEELRRLLPPMTELYYIIGADTFYQLHNWKKYERILELASFITVPRAGYSLEELRANYLLLSNFEQMHIMLVDTVVPDMSSTDIRRRVAQKLPVQDMVTLDVWNYIQKRNLYENAAPSFEKIQEDLQKRLQPYRYQHTLGVVEAAEELATRYGCPLPEARWAALLHDCAKEEEKKGAAQLHKEYGLPVKEEYESAPQLIHASLGVILAKERYSFYDEHVLKAIAAHTTGSQNMNLLDKVLLVADMIEKNRNYEGVESLREIARKNLDKAALAALDHKISFVLSKDAYLSLDSVDARQQLWLETR